MATPDRTLADLTDRLGRGDREALGEIWDRFGPQLRRRARTRLRQLGIASQTESMDICNDVLSDLARRGQWVIDNPDGLIGYLMRAIDLQATDALRGLGRQCRDFRRTHSPPEGFDAATEDSSPSAALIRREILAAVAQRLGSDDAAIVDYVVQGRDWNEIAALTGLAPDTARMRLRRAVAKTRDDLKLQDES